MIIATRLPLTPCSQFTCSKELIASLAKMPSSNMKALTLQGILSIANGQHRSAKPLDGAGAGVEGVGYLSRMGNSFLVWSVDVDRHKCVQVRER